MSARAKVLDALAVGVIVHDASLKIVYANEAATELLGVKASEIVERDAADPRWVVVHPDGTPVTLDEVPATIALRTREPVRGIILGVSRPDGIRTWLAIDAVPLLDPGGAVELVAVSISDVTRELTARMQLEAVRESLGKTILERDASLAQAVYALESSEAHYRAVLRAMAEGVAVHAPDGSIVFANPAAESILGLTLEQMQGRHPVDPAWKLTDATGVPLASEQIPSEITRRSGVPQRNTLLGVQRGSSGEHAWLSVSTDPIRPAPNEERFSVVTTFTDVTVERYALEDVQRARDHLQDIAAALPGVVIEYLVRPDGSDEFRYVSAPAKEYFGIDPAEAMRNSGYIWSHVHGDDRKTAKDQILAAIGNVTELHLEIRVMRPDGEFRHARLRAGPPKRVAEGMLFRAVGFDVTEQRRLEEKVREAQRREAIGTLAAGMAHNFNNMLAAILPSIEMVQAEAPPELAADLDDARTAARAASELVRQLMQLVRKDTRSGATAVDVIALVREVVQMCRRTFDPHIQIGSDVVDGPCAVLARRAELQQVLMNLCINARDALEGRSGARLHLTATEEPDDVVIVVEDNGAGMPPDVQRRIGEPFFTTKPPGRGTGLGLATAFGIVSELRGSLTCQSTPGVGTRFELRVPRLQAAVGSDAGHRQPSLPPPRKVRVLLIDDEDLVRKTLERALQHEGAEVLSASGGAEGLALLRAHAELDLVLLDVAMPDIGGAEVLRRLREIDANVAVYLMTGFLPEGFDMTGATGVLSKPLELARLRALVAEAARARR
jgi:PAS domain S-box-containing protein